MCLQYPIGRASDRYDRRLVILLLCAPADPDRVVDGAAAGALARASRGDSCLPAGGMAFSIYPLSLSHACDELRPDQVLGANQGLLLAYSLGAMTGPLLAPLPWQRSDHRGCSSTLPCAVCCCRPISAGAGVSEPHSADGASGFHTCAPQHPMTAELEPRTDLEGEAVPASYAVPDAEERAVSEEGQERDAPQGR